MRYAPALAAALCSLLLLGCPDSTSTPGDANGSSSGTPNVNGTSEEGPVVDTPNNGTAPAPASEWVLIDDSTSEELNWPLLEPVSRWTAPTALTDLDEPTREKHASSAKVLRELVELLVNPSLHPNDFDAALKLDSAGRLHLTVGRGRPMGSATLDSHGPDFPPVFSLALEKPGPRATNVSALREAVAQVVPSDLARELAQKDNMLEPHPKVPGAANAFLDRSGYGAQFPYLYAFSSDDQLLLVFQEVPHGTAPDGPR